MVISENRDIQTENGEKRAEISTGKMWQMELWGVSAAVQSQMNAHVEILMQ
jgi:hypothetical protein